MVSILGRQFPGTQPALQFASVKRSVVVAVEPVKQRRCRRLRLVEVNRTVTIGIEELQGACGPARCEALRSRTHDGEEHGETEHFGGCLPFEFSRTPPPRKM